MATAEFRGLDYKFHWIIPASLDKKALQKLASRAEGKSLSWARLKRKDWVSLLKMDTILSRRSTMSRNFTLFALLAMFFAIGCEGTGVGDPCSPESVRDDGFQAAETYFERNSVQCKTRLCLVRGLEGDPSYICPEENPENNACVDQDVIDDTVYCTCHCRAAPGSSVPTCSCPSGFECTDILETGGEGLRGGYCTRVEPS